MEIPTSPNLENPYNEGNGYVSRLSNMDNGNTIIIFEESHTGSIEDTLISARQQWEVSKCKPYLQSVRSEQSSCRAGGDGFHFI